MVVTVSDCVTGIGDVTALRCGSSAAHVGLCHDFVICPHPWQRETSVDRGQNKKVRPSLNCSPRRSPSHPDQLLKDAVAEHGEHDNWKNIALCIPGRTNKACRKVLLLSHPQMPASNFVCSAGCTRFPPTLKRRPGPQKKTSYLWSFMTSMVPSGLP